MSSAHGWSRASSSTIGRCLLLELAGERSRGERLRGAQLLRPRPSTAHPDMVLYDLVIDG